MIAPVADGRAGMAALFDLGADATPSRLRLDAVERWDDDMLSLRYCVDAS